MKRILGALVVVATLVPSQVSAVDLVPVQFTSGPPALSRSASATIDWAWPDDVESFRCIRDGVYLPDCAPPMTLSGLGEGPHAFTVETFDKDSRQVGAGSWSWTVDSLPPSIVTSPLPTSTLGSSVRFGWSATDLRRYDSDVEGSGVAVYDVRYRTATEGSGLGGWVVPAGWSGRISNYVDLAVAAGRTYCFSVRSRDRHQNASPWSVDRCVAKPLDDRGLTASTGWTRTTGTAYYAGTATVARMTGASLTRTGVRTDTVQLLASVCPTCGTVGVYWNGTLIKKLSLSSSTTVNRKLLAVADFPRAQSGTLIVKTLNASPVYVDGVLLNHGSSSVAPLLVREDYNGMLSCLAYVRVTGAAPNTTMQTVGTGYLSGTILYADPPKPLTTGATGTGTTTQLFGRFAMQSDLSVTATANGVISNPVRIRC